jgi:hypothetical protein
MWADVDNFERLSERLIIVREAIFSKQTEKTPCDVSTIMTEQQQCAWRDIKNQKLNIWYPMAMHNAFISNARKTEV